MGGWHRDTKRFSTLAKAPHPTGSQAIMGINIAADRTVREQQQGSDTPRGPQLPSDHTQSEAILCSPLPITKLWRLGKEPPRFSSTLVQRPWSVSPQPISPRLVQQAARWPPPSPRPPTLLGVQALG